MSAGGAQVRRAGASAGRNAAGTRKVSIRLESLHGRTEHGIARLRGRTVRERTRELIAVADPRFREELTAQAKKLGYL